jgi:hypothetical protein
MRFLPDQPVFDRADARALGWSDSALTRAIQSGRIVQIRRGQFCRPDQGGDTSDVFAVARETQRRAAIAAARVKEHGVVSHRSALVLHGLPVVGQPAPAPELTVPPRGAGLIDDAHLHRATLAPDDVVLVDGVPVTSPARTVFDVARSRSLSTGVSAMDAAIQRGLASPEQLHDLLRRYWNWPGIRRAQRAVALADGNSESPLESVSRLVFSAMHLPRPRLQALTLDRDGHPAGRLDFYWDEFGVAGEADGRGKYDARTVLTLEKIRQEHLENHAMVFVRWGWSDVFWRRQLLRARLLSGFERGSARDRSGFPRQWSISRGQPNI